MSTLRTPAMFYHDPASTEGGRTKDPSVIRFRGAYWMYYTLWLSRDRTGVGIARSGDLVHWEPFSVLELEGALEAEGIAAPGAIVIGDRVHLFYQSYSMKRWEECAILHAWSGDGVRFTRDPSNPIVRPRHADGSPYDWCNGRAIDADAVVVGRQLNLYYATRDPSGRVQMVGASTAGLSSDFSRDTWRTLSPGGPLIRPGVPTPLDDPRIDLSWEGDCIEATTMIRRAGHFYMFYAGNYNQRPQQIGVALSADGIHFARLLGGQPLLRCGAPDEWNGGESGHPGAFVDEDGSTHLFFQGCNMRLSPPLDWRLSKVRIGWRGAAGSPDLPFVIGE